MNSKVNDNLSKNVLNFENYNEISKEISTEVSDNSNDNTLKNSPIKEIVEDVRVNETSSNMLSICASKSKKHMRHKIILSVFAVTIVFTLIISVFVCVSAYNKYSVISKSINNMNTSTKNFRETIKKTNIVYDIVFKKKNEKEILDILKNNLYDASTIE